MLDTTDISRAHAIDSDLNETQYIVEMDNRLGILLDPNGGTNPAVSYIDDDNIASYYISLSSNPNMVKSIGTAEAGSISTDIVAGSTTPIAGPRGTRLRFMIGSSLELQTSTYLFDLIGLSSNVTVNSVTCKAIDTMIRVTGVTTGASVDIPVRYIKKTS